MLSFGLGLGLGLENLILHYSTGLWSWRYVNLLSNETIFQ